MSSSRNAFAKFTLKPSSLSQHTVNFNKILEQVPVPKIDPLELVKPLDPIKTETNSQQESSLTTEKENTQTNTENAKEFVFGEKLTDRVVNIASENNDEKNNNSNNNDDIKNSQNSQNGDLDNKNQTTETKTSLWTSAINENDADQIEHNDANTFLRLNCKLFLLDTDKAKWLERGYGILKLIDSNDGLNCKIMMWTDKTFRNILNTKFFEKMQIDRANSKSIRFNANDNGSVRIFLVKTGNSNDCDELYSKLQLRFNEYLTQLESSKTSSDSKSSEVTSSLSQTEAIVKNRKDIQFKCNCDYIKNGDDESTINIPSKIHLYHYIQSTLKTAPNAIMQSNSHQLLIDIVDATDESIIYLSTYLKLIKTKKHTAHPLEFEINQSHSIIKSSQSTLLNNNLIIHDQEAANKFLNYYDKEPKFVESLSSDESELNNSEDSNENDEDEVQVRKNENVKVTDDDSGDENQEENENEATNEQDQIDNDKTNKKRKNNSSENLNSKSFKKSESDLSNTNDSDCKRSQSDDESSKDQVFKKTKVFEEEKD